MNFTKFQNLQSVLEKYWKITPILCNKSCSHKSIEYETGVFLKNSLNCTHVQTFFAIISSKTSYILSASPHIYTLLEALDFVGETRILLSFFILDLKKAGLWEKNKRQNWTLVHTNLHTSPDEWSDKVTIYPHPSPFNILSNLEGGKHVTLFTHMHVTIHHVIDKMDFWAKVRNAETI